MYIIKRIITFNKSVFMVAKGRGRCGVATAVLMLKMEDANTYFSRFEMQVIFSRCCTRGLYLG